MDLQIFEFPILYVLFIAINLSNSSVCYPIYISQQLEIVITRSILHVKKIPIISVWFNGNGLLAGAIRYLWPLVSLTHGNFPESNGQRFPRPCRARLWYVAVIYALVRRWIGRPETLWSWPFIARQFGRTWLRTSWSFGNVHMKLTYFSFGRLRNRGPP